MASLVEHILRVDKLARKLRAHSCHWSDLPEQTIPSAAVSDHDTEWWGDVRYLDELIVAFLDTARETCAQIACPLVETILARPVLDDQDVELTVDTTPLIDTGEKLRAWKLALGIDRHRNVWWLGEHRRANRDLVVLA